MIKFALNAGEMAPLAVGRADLDASQRGLRQCWNFLPSVYGAVFRRPGAEVVGGALTGSVRLIRFEVAEGVSYVLVFSPLRMRVWRVSDVPVMVAEVATPWSSGLERLGCCQVNDVLFVCHENVRPYRVERHSESVWRVVEMPLKHFPWKDSLLQTMGLHGTAANHDLWMTAPSAFFTGEMKDGRVKMRLSRVFDAQDYVHDKPAMVEWNDFGRSIWPNGGEGFEFLCQFGQQFFQTKEGGYCYCWRVKSDLHRSVYEARGRSSDPAAYPEYLEAGVVPMTWEGASDVLVKGSWRLQTAGAWEAEWWLMRAENVEAVLSRNLDWRLHERLFSVNWSETNYSLSGQEESAVYMQLRLVMFKNDKDCGVPRFHVDTFRYDYVGSVVEVGADGLTGRLQLDSWVGVGRTPMRSTFWTQDWSLSAWGGVQGWPTCVAFYQGRLFFGGMRGQPTRVIGSAVDDYGSFMVGEGDSDAVDVTLQSRDKHGVRWMSGGQGLVIGTSEAEWVVEGGNEKPITPTSVRAVRVSGAGCEGVPVAVSVHGVAFVQFGGKRLRLFSGSDDAQGYVPQDLNAFAEHAAGAGCFKGLAVQRWPVERFWALRDDGVLGCLTIDVAQGVFAWSRHGLSVGKVRAVECVRGDAEDEVWVVVEDEGRLSLMRLRESRDVFLDGWRCALPVPDNGGRFAGDAGDEAGDPDLPGSWPVSERNPVRMKGGAGVPPWGALPMVKDEGDGLVRCYDEEGRTLQGRRFTSSLVTMPFDVPESAAKGKGASVAGALFFRTWSERVSMSLDGRAWTRLDWGHAPVGADGVWRAEQQLTGWRLSPVPGVWDEFLVLGVRCDGLHQCAVLSGGASMKIKS